MSTKFYVNIGKKAYGYGKDSQSDFELNVFPIKSTLLGDAVAVHFNVQSEPGEPGKRHHAGTFKTSPEIARWLAYALLAACEAPKSAHANSIKVEGNKITKRHKGI
jgi:hypothetical protein